MTSIQSSKDITGSAGIPPEAMTEFSSNLRGQMILPGHAEYEQARKVWNGMIDKRPAMIVRCAGVSDVINSVKFARKYDLDLAVRGGGHNVAGNCVCDGGMVIDFSAMKSVRVDPQARTVRAEPGVIWNEFDRETQEFGLAVTGGLVSTTGISGFTLGGGIGWLVRKHGLTLDSLLSVDIVTAEGTLVKASELENPDLFWGIRGGGGNFGVVTSFEYELHPVGPIIFGGMILYPIESAKEVLKFYREFVKTSPQELTTLAALITAPPAPVLPAEVHGKQVLAILGCYSGSIEDGAMAVKPLKNHGDAVADLFQPMPYRVLQSLLDAAARAGLQNYWKSEYLSQLSDGAIETILEYNAKVPSPETAVHIHHTGGGASSRVAEDATAFSHRDAQFIVNIVGTWSDPSQNDRNIRWVREFFSRVQAYSSGGVYVNFLGEEGAERVKAAYGEQKYKRLVDIKRKYDPSNFFHLNQNIGP